MRYILITSIAAVVLMGCAKNDIKLVNNGTNEWQQIHINGGGQVFQIKKIKGKATETIRFKSKAEDGGQVSGMLGGQVHKTKFGYFTPNLSTRHDIIFDDNGTITIVVVP